MQIAQHNFGTMEMVPSNCDIDRGTRQYVSFKMVSELAARKRQEMCPIGNPKRYKLFLMKMQFSEVISLEWGVGKLILDALIHVHISRGIWVS
jgi:hypothetical protein